MKKSYQIEPINGGICGGNKRHRITIRDENGFSKHHFCNSFDESIEYVSTALKQTRTETHHPNG